MSILTADDLAAVFGGQEQGKSYPNQAVGAPKDGSGTPTMLECTANWECRPIGTVPTEVVNAAKKHVPIAMSELPTPLQAP